MEDHEFVIGDTVAYGINGVCTVEDIRPMAFSEGMDKSLYYILAPEASDKSKIFVPVENNSLVSRIRELLTEEEIDGLIRDACGEEIRWETDRRFRMETFHRILAAGVNSEMLFMIRCINAKKDELTEMGKKLPITDSNTLKTAVRLVKEEFSHGLHIEKDEVKTYISNLAKEAV